MDGAVKSGQSKEKISDFTEIDLEPGIHRYDDERVERPRLVSEKKKRRNRKLWEPDHQKIVKGID